MGIFGFNLPYSNEMIEMAENQIGMSKEEIRKIDDPEERFKELLEIFLEEELSGTGAPAEGATGGMVDKKKKGNKIISPKKNKKPKLAGRLAKRGYGAARK